MKKTLSLSALALIGLFIVGCGSSQPVPVADKQDKTPPANSKVGQAVRKFREKRGGTPMGPDAGVKAP